jgi:MFS family permease
MSAALWRLNLRLMSAWKALTMLHFFAGALTGFYTDWGGLTLTQTFLLQAWFFVCIFFLEVPTGAVADRWGRKASLVCASASLLLAAILYASTRGMAAFMLAELVWAAAAAFASGADEAMVYDSLKELGQEKDSKRHLARLGSFEIGAIAVAAPIGSLIAARWGPRAPMIAMLVPFAAGLLLSCFLKEPPSGRSEERRDYFATLTDGARYFARHGAMRALAFDSVTVWASSFMIVWLFQPRLRELGVPLAAFGFVTAAMTLSQILLLTNADRVERAVGGTRRYLLLSATIPGLCYLALPFATRPAAAIALLVPLAAFGLSRSTIISNYLHKLVDSPRRATAMSTVGMTRQLCAALALCLTGLLVKVSLAAAFAVLGCLTLLSAWASSVEEAHLQD